MPPGTEADRAERAALYLEVATAVRARVACGWTVADWLAVLRRVRPRDARAVVLRVLHGMDFPAIGERLGGVSRGMADQLYRRGVNGLRGAAAVKGLVRDAEAE